MKIIYIYNIHIQYYIQGPVDRPCVLQKAGITRNFPYVVE